MFGVMLTINTGIHHWDDIETFIIIVSHRVDHGVNFNEENNHRINYFTYKISLWLFI